MVKRDNNEMGRERSDNAKNNEKSSSPALCPPSSSSLFAVTVPLLSNVCSSPPMAKEDCFSLLALSAPLSPLARDKLDSTDTTEVPDLGTVEIHKKDK